MASFSINKDNDLFFFEEEWSQERERDRVCVNDGHVRPATKSERRTLFPRVREGIRTNVPLEKGVSAPLLVQWVP